MNRFSLPAAIAAAVIITTAAAHAAVYRVTASFGGGSLGAVSLDVTIDADFSVSIDNNTTSGLTINSLSSVPDNGLVYGYIQSLDRLNIGGAVSGAGGVAGWANDFVVSIKNLHATPELFYLADASQSDGFGNPTIESLTVRRLDIGEVPLPAGLPLLMAGVAYDARRPGPGPQGPVVRGEVVDDDVS